MSHSHIKNIQQYLTWFYAGLLLFLAVQRFLPILGADISLISVLPSVVFVILAFLLIKQIRLARRFTAAICLLIAILLPIGVFNPFAAMDGIQLPSINTVLLWLIPTEFFALTSAYFLDYDCQAS